MLGHKVSSPRNGPRRMPVVLISAPSAMYICNDQDVELNIPMTDAVSLAYVVHSYCGWSESRGYSFDAVSGQGYTDNNGGKKRILQSRLLRLSRSMLTTVALRL